MWCNNCDFFFIWCVIVFFIIFLIFVFEVSEMVLRIVNYYFKICQTNLFFSSKKFCYFFFHLVMIKHTTLRIENETTTKNVYQKKKKNG